MGEATKLPLAVDLDGTLIFTDMSRVTIRRVVLPRFWLIPWIFFLDLTGKRARWKRILGRKLKFDPAELEYNEAKDLDKEELEEVMKEIREEKRKNSFFC